MIQFTPALKNAPEVIKLVEQYPDQFSDILEIAMNKTIRKSLGEVKRMYKTKWSLRPKAYQGMKSVSAKFKKGYGQSFILAPTKAIDFFDHLRPKPAMPMTGITQGGVTITLMGKSMQFSTAFVAQMPNGSLGVFKAVSDGQLNSKGKPKIKRLATTNLFGMFHSEKTNLREPITEFNAKVFEEIFIAECHKRGIK